MLKNEFKSETINFQNYLVTFKRVTKELIKAARNYKIMYLYILGNLKVKEGTTNDIDIGAYAGFINLSNKAIFELEN